MKRLHPFSAVQRALGTAFQLGSMGFFAGIMLSGPLGLVEFWAVLVLGGLGVLIGGAYGVVQYLRFTYEAAGDTLAVSSGVFNRQERAIPLGRIQNVDVSRSLVQRILGLAVVRFETAGGGSTEAVLDAVSVDEADRLQEFVAAHGRHAQTGSDEAEPGDVDAARTATDEPASSAGPRAGGPESTLLYELDLRDLLVLGVVTAVPAAPVLVVIGTPVLGDLAISLVSATSGALGGPETVRFELLPTYTPTELVIVATVALVQFAIATWVLSAALTIVQFYDFRLSQVGDELRYERGLLNRYSGSIPVEKIQTVTIRETAPMRQFGLAALSVETAGYSPAGNDGQTANTAIPLDDRETVVELAESLGEFEYVDVERPPPRARRRYAVRFALVPLGLTALLGLVDAYVFAITWWYAPLVALLLAPLAGHLRWKNRGHALAEEAFLAQSGFWSRSTRAVPYYRVQTVIGSRTVFQRYRRLVSVTADTASSTSIVGGDATAHDVDDAVGREIHDTLRERLDEERGRAVRRVDSPDASVDFESDAGGGGDTTRDDFTRDEEK